MTRPELPPCTPRFDDRGVLRDPDFHDGHLVGLAVPGPGEAVLTLRDRAGREFTITLHEVERLRAQDFAEGNVIFDLTVTAAVDSPADLLEAVFGNPREGASGFQPLEYVRRARPDHRLLALSLSYGCSLLVLFRHMTVRGPEPLDRST